MSPSRKDGPRYKTGDSPTTVEGFHLDRSVCLVSYAVKRTCGTVVRFSMLTVNRCSSREYSVFGSLVGMFFLVVIREVEASNL
jgi:hypothetical protein